MPNPTPSDTGRQYEDLACQYLLQQGMVFQSRNYHSRFGEIDLIMQDQDSLVFVEVRFRRNNKFGSAAASVDYRKQMKLIRCAEHYIADKQINCPIRFDVVGIGGGQNGHEIEWIANAFQTN